MKDGLIQEQISLFENDLIPGQWVETHGKQLTFDEITSRVGEVIIYEKSTESHEWFQAVRVEKIVIDLNTGERRLIFFDGRKQRGLVDERYFRPDYSGRFPARAFEVS